MYSSHISYRPRGPVDGTSTISWSSLSFGSLAFFSFDCSNRNPSGSIRYPGTGKSWSLKEDHQWEKNTLRWWYRETACPPIWTFALLSHESIENSSGCSAHLTYEANSCKILMSISVVFADITCLDSNSYIQGIFVCVPQLCCWVRASADCRSWTLTHLTSLPHSSEHAPGYPQCEHCKM